MKRNKILLINPPQTYPYELEDEYQSYIPMGITSLASISEAVNFETKILDCLEDETIEYKDNNIRFGKSEQVIINAINEFQPDIVGIGNSFSMFIKDADEIARLVKAINKDIIVVLGGLSPSLNPISDSILSNNNYDILIKGEGEATLQDLLEHFDKQKAKFYDLEIIQGIYYRENEKLVENSNRKFIENLSDLPMPAFHLLNIDKVLSNRFYSRWRNNPIDKRTIPIFTSRGCPYNCIFCSIHSQVGYRYRTYSNEYIIKYIKICIEEYGIRHFHFEDDNLTYDYQRAKDLFREMQNLGITWDTPNGVRADTINDELMNLMIHSGLTSISIAAESGDDEVLNNIIQKRMNTQDVLNAAKLADKYNLPCVVFFVVGFPGETMTQINKTIEFSIQLTREFGTINIFYVANPLPGTKLEEIALQSGYMIKNFNESDYLKAIRINQKALIKTDEFSKKMIFDSMAKYLSADEFSVHGSTIPMFWSARHEIMLRAQSLYPKLNLNKCFKWEWMDV